MLPPVDALEPVKAGLEPVKAGFEPVKAAFEPAKAGFTKAGFCCVEAPNAGLRAGLPKAGFKAGLEEEPYKGPPVEVESEPAYKPGFSEVVLEAKGFVVGVVPLKPLSWNPVRGAIE